MIVATAGHVDHGKTSLIKQLTGVDTDRLEEEKRRGLSISLGYAYLQREKGIPIGFIDVPGHQRFINTMISGISGIDMGLLVVAADDGAMPQTREHLDVLQVLGIRKLVVVISKIDRATRERQAQVNQDIRALLDGIYWDSLEIFSVSNTSGQGIDALRNYLLTYDNEQDSCIATGCFRLSVDRAFTVKGAGVVVTGTVSTGQVHTGDTLQVHPGNMPARVRGLRAHDQEAQTATAGQRCAINLAGNVSLADIARGNWLLATETAPPSQRLDVECSLLGCVPFALKHLSPVKMYIGATRMAGRIALLQTDSSKSRLHPGSHCLAQLILEADVPCYSGQRFLLRDHAEKVLLGGGTILDPEGLASRKSRPARIAFLNAIREDSWEKSLAKLLELDISVDLTRFKSAWNLQPEDKVRVPASTALEFEAEGKHWLAKRSCWQEADKAMTVFLQDWHNEHPVDLGIKANALRSALLTRYGSPLLMAVLTAKLRSGSFKLSEGRISQANFRPAVPEVSVSQWKLLQSYLAQCGVHIPLQSELCAETGIAPKELEDMARVAIRDGRLFRVSERRYALPAQLLDLSGSVLELWNAEEALNVIALKHCWGAGRNLTIEILEFFDNIRFTQRRGDIRIVLDNELPARLFHA